MKTNSYKNKKPIFLKFFQITALLIGSAFFTVQAAATVSMFPTTEVSILPVNDWEKGADGLTYIQPFELILFDPMADEYVDAHISFPYEITLEYDSDIISIEGGVGGAVSFSGLYPNPDAVVSLVVDEFLIYTLLTNSITPIKITSATLDGVPLKTRNFDLELPLGSPISTVPLPAAFPLMVSAIAAVGFLGSKRKKLIPQS